MIALFDEPPRVSISPRLNIGRVGLLMGMTFDSRGPHALRGVIVMDDGSISHLSVDQFTVDYRYDVTTDKWVDTNETTPDQ